VKSESIWSKALEVSRKAVNCGAVIPLNTIKYKSREDSCDFELRFLKSPIPKYLTEYGPKRNPFIPWDTRLQIQPINDKHTLILNKYPVQIGHMLLITNTWMPQNGWLNKMILKLFKMLITIPLVYGSLTVVKRLVPVSLIDIFNYYQDAMMRVFVLDLIGFAHY